MTSAGGAGGIAGIGGAGGAGAGGGGGGGGTGTGGGTGGGSGSGSGERSPTTTVFVTTALTSPLEYHPHPHPLLTGRRIRVPDRRASSLEHSEGIRVEVPLDPGASIVPAQDSAIDGALVLQGCRRGNCEIRRRILGEGDTRQRRCGQRGEQDDPDG